VSRGTPFIGLARTIYIQCIFGIFGKEIKGIYDVYLRFWPTLFFCSNAQAWHLLAIIKTQSGCGSAKGGGS
jgi:hypothetical protein